MTFEGGGRSHQRPTSQKERAVLESGRGQFDLRTPPSREEAGFPEEVTAFAYQELGGDPFVVDVLLPGGTTLTMESTFVSFATRTVRRPTSDPPVSMEISRGLLSAEDARDRLLALAAQFDLEVEPINEWYRIADSQRVPASDGIPNTPFLTTKLGYLSLSVQGRYLPTGDTAVVAVSLFWGGPAFRARTSAPPAPTPS
ncbi:MAG: hypothetical protein ACT4PP_07465 [Sporichthyaceae bacterium]